MKNKKGNFLSQKYDFSPSLHASLHLAILTFLELRDIKSQLCYRVRTVRDELKIQTFKQNSKQKINKKKFKQAIARYKVRIAL